MLALSLGTVDKYDLSWRNITFCSKASDRSRKIYVFSSKKAFEKQTKVIKDQGKKRVEVLQTWKHPNNNSGCDSGKSVVHNWEVLGYLGPTWYLQVF